MSKIQGSSTAKTGLLLVVMALIISCISFIYFAIQDVGFLHFDTQAHLLIARRVCDSSSPGLAQLGAVWLPLTHLLSLPLVCSDVWANTTVGTVILAMLLGVTVVTLNRKASGLRFSLRIIFLSVSVVLYLLVWGALRTSVFYTSGIGMTAISMIAYCLLGYYMFKFVLELTNSQGAGVVAWLVVMLNPNILYLQSTSMTELPMYFGVLISMYTFWRLSKEPSNLKWLMWSGLSCFVMTTIRYEGWVMLVAQGCIYIFILVRARMNIGAILGHLSQWGFGSAIGVILWIVWNMTIFGNPLEFQNGQYSAPSNWVSGREAGYGNLRLAFLTYGWGIWDTVGVLVLVGVIGLVVYLLTTRLRKESLAPLLPLVMIPFFGIMIYKGQRPMQVTQIEDAIYNIRFALIIILTTAPMIGYLVKSSRILRVAASVVILASHAIMLVNPGISTLIEPQKASAFIFSQLQIDAANWLSDNYDERSMLLEGYGNEQLQFLSGINLREIIYEGTYRLWEPILNAPYANNIEWVIMRGPYSGFQADQVWFTVREQQSFLDHYVLVFQNDLYSIYKLVPDVEQ